MTNRSKFRVGNIGFCHYFSNLLGTFS